MLRGNVNPLFQCCKWGVRTRLGRRCGVIVNISSVSALSGSAGRTNSYITGQCLVVDGGIV